MKGIELLCAAYGMDVPPDRLPKIGDNPLTKAWAASSRDISFWDWCMEEIAAIPIALNAA